MITQCSDPETVSQYLEGILSEVDRQQFEVHTARCDACAVLLAGAAGSATAVAPSKALEARVFGMYHG